MAPANACGRLRCRTASLLEQATDIASKGIMLTSDRTMGRGSIPQTNLRPANGSPVLCDYDRVAE